MKRPALSIARVAAALLAAALTACATWPGGQAAPEASASAGTSSAEGTAYGTGRGYGAGSGRLAMGDMGDRQAMCELNRRMMAARTPEARQAVIDKYMGTMSHETRHHLLQMMREQCG